MSNLPTVAVLLALAAPAQFYASAQAAAEIAAPTRAARLTCLAGAVQIQRSDNTGEESAVLNMPLAEGTRIVTGDYGQAELEFEDGSVARLTPRSALSLDVLALDSGQAPHTELGLLGGLAYFELRKSTAATWLVNAGGTRVTPVENLTLRVDFDQPPAAFAVLTGSAQVERPEAFDVELRAGETLRLDTEDPARYFLTRQIAPESWDSWNESRDQSAADAAEKRTAARNDYAGPQGYGWSDLDAGGSWYNLPGTGPIWQPDNADEGFDPYGYGAWVWGGGSYVFASGYPWGWTPYRCGHWEFFPGFGWGWQPDLSCGRWAFAGGGYYQSGGILLRGAYPPRHNPVVRPQPRPGSGRNAPQPVIPVRGADGLRPPTIHRPRALIAGANITALPAIAAPAPHSGSAVGQALARDFPIDRITRQPVLGVASGAATSPEARPSAPLRSPRTAPTPADPASFADHARDPGNHPPAPANSSHIAPSTRAPERTVAPAQQAPVQSAPPPVHYNPPPPPPVHYNPPPPPPAPPPAPVHASPSRPS